MAGGPVESVSTVELGLPAAVVFARLTALRNHERLIPLTRIDTPDRAPAIGDRVTATSAVVLVDTMELVELQPPHDAAAGRARWVKHGPVLLGEAEIVVTPLAEGHCRVAWVERDIRLAGLPTALTVRPLTALIGLMTRLALARFVRLSSH